MGAMQAMIQHHQNGLLFESNSHKGLEKCIDIAMNSESEKLIVNAFSDYQEYYSKEANYKALIKIYEGIIN